MLESSIEPLFTSSQDDFLYLDDFKDLPITSHFPFSAPKLISLYSFIGSASSRNCQYHPPQSLTDRF